MDITINNLNRRLCNLWPFANSIKRLWIRAKLDAHVESVRIAGLSKKMI